MPRRANPLKFVDRDLYSSVSWQGAVIARLLMLAGAKHRSGGWLYSPRAKQINANCTIPDAMKRQRTFTALDEAKQWIASQLQEKSA